VTELGRREMQGILPQKYFTPRFNAVGWLSDPWRQKWPPDHRLQPPLAPHQAAPISGPQLQVGGRLDGQGPYHRHWSASVPAPHQAGQYQVLSFRSEVDWMVTGLTTAQFKLVILPVPASPWSWPLHLGLHGSGLMPPVTCAI
jgi:hypothetical protein